MSPLVIFYDGGCGLCVRSAELLRRADVGGALRFEAANVPAVLAYDGATVFAGFFAVRRALHALPRLRLLAVLLGLPGMAWIGPRVYAAIARNRRQLGCLLGVDR